MEIELSVTKPCCAFRSSMLIAALALSWTLQAVELYRVHTPHYYLITVYCLNLYLLPHKTRHALKGGEDISRNEIKRPHSIVLDVLLQIANISKKEKFAMHIHTLHSYK